MEFLSTIIFHFDYFFFNFNFKVIAIHAGCCSTRVKKKDKKIMHIGKKILSKING